jgi:hypothetical protein
LSVREAEAQTRLHSRNGFARLVFPFQPWRQNVVQFSFDKYLHIQEGIMGTTDGQQEPSAENPCEAPRVVIRLALDSIGVEIGAALRTAHLDYEVYLTVPTSGNAAATITTPLDVSDKDWTYPTAIICRIIERRLGGVTLRGRYLPCAMASSRMDAAEQTVDLDADR